jgi:hypothetical protein
MGLFGSILKTVAHVAEPILAGGAVALGVGLTATGLGAPAGVALVAAGFAGFGASSIASDLVAGTRVHWLRALAVAGAGALVPVASFALAGAGAAGLDGAATAVGTGFARAGTVTALQTGRVGGIWVGKELATDELVEGAAGKVGTAGVLLGAVAEPRVAEEDAAKDAEAARRGDQSTGGEPPPSSTKGLDGALGSLGQ